MQLLLKCYLEFLKSIATPFQVFRTDSPGEGLLILKKFHLRNLHHGLKMRTVRPEPGKWTSKAPRRSMMQQRWIPTGEMWLASDPLSGSGLSRGPHKHS